MGINKFFIDNIPYKFVFHPKNLSKKNFHRKFINQLKKEKIIEQKDDVIEKMKNELADIDEFRIAMEKKYTESDFNEKRVNMLKGRLYSGLSKKF